MIITAKLRYLHIAPRKVRLVADLMRGKSVEQSQGILEFTNKKASQILLKLLRSALANAKNNFQLNETNLYISKILVDEGPKSKRWRPRSRGRANEILKRTSHITVVLDEIEKKDIGKKKKLFPKKVIEKIEKTKASDVTVDKKVAKKREQERKLRFEKQKPKVARGLKRVFRRKAF